MPIAFDNSYARLSDRFYARLDPTPVREPTLIRLNEGLARKLGMDPVDLGSPAGVAMLAGNTVPEGAEPLAQAYAGHQFGGWVPQLGDGRAILLGEVVTADGRRDIQLKGSGRTPYSRMGDGRAWLGPVLREYVVSRGDARARHPDDPRARRGRDGRDGPARGATARRGAHPRREEPYPGRHIPVLSCPQRPGSAGGL